MLFGFRASTSTGTRYDVLYMVEGYTIEADSEGKKYYQGVFV